MMKSNRPRRSEASVLALSALLAILSATRAEAAMAMKSGEWELSFDGFVNGFAVYQPGTATPAGVVPDAVFMSNNDSFRIRTGLLGGFRHAHASAPFTRARPRARRGAPRGGR